MKKCIKCNNTKELHMFYINRSSCKDCFKLSRKEYLSNESIKKKRAENQLNWSRQNKEKIKEYSSRFYQNNKEQHSSFMKEYHANPEIKIKRKEYDKKYCELNRGAVNNKTAKRRASKLNATIGNYKDEISSIYKSCPKGYHVDHVIPLKGKTVCGLHVPWNLRVITAEENLKKSNKLIDSVLTYN